MKFPDIPDKYFRHFVRGIFEGDGSVYLDNQTVRVKLLSGSLEFVKTLQERMYQAGFQKRKIDIHYIKKDNIKISNHHVICYSSKSSVKQFFSFIYENVPESMYYCRKHDFFLSNWARLEYK